MNQLPFTWVITLDWETSEVNCLNIKGIIMCKHFSGWKCPASKGENLSTYSVCKSALIHFLIHSTCSTLRRGEREREIYFERRGPNGEGGEQESGRGKGSSRVRRGEVPWGRRGTARWWSTRRAPLAPPSTARWRRRREVRRTAAPAWWESLAQRGKEEHQSHTRPLNTHCAGWRLQYTQKKMYVYTYIQPMQAIVYMQDACIQCWAMHKVTQFVLV